MISQRRLAISNLEKKSVKKVIELLRRLRHSEEVIELTDTARSAEDAAKALNVPVGAIVKTLVFIIDANTEQIPIVALVAGDNRCNTSELAKSLGISGIVVRPDADKVKILTGYSIGGVSPVGLPEALHLIIDTSLKRFKTIWSAAGHPHCVFAATYEQLVDITKATESADIT